MVLVQPSRSVSVACTLTARDRCQSHHGPRRGLLDGIRSRCQGGRITLRLMAVRRSETRIARLGVGVTLALSCICFPATAQEPKITVTGKLIRALAIGGESTGWVIQLESEISIDGKPVNSIEVDSHEIKEFKKLENKRVEASGKLSHRRGVETGNRPILDVSSIRELKAKPTPAATFNLDGGTMTSDAGDFCCGRFNQAPNHPQSISTAFRVGVDATGMS